MDYNFKFSLSINTSSNQYFNSFIPEGEVEIKIMLNEICDKIADSRTVVFEVGGFGQDDWNADVGTDLCTILQQFPQFYSEFKIGKTARLDFYEQGMERILNFSHRKVMPK